MHSGVNKLVVFQKSHQLVLQIYSTTRTFPKEELFGITSQIRRAAVSVPSNIIEGRSRGTSKEYRRFLIVARGSLEEVKYQLLLSRDLGYISKENYNELLNLTDLIGKLLNGLIVKVA